MLDIYTVHKTFCKLDSLASKRYNTGELLERTAHSMARNNKREWRSRWIDEFVVDKGIKSCNFFTLPGPEILDVKELSSKTSVLSNIMVERKGPGAQAIANNIGRTPLSREAMAAGLAASSLNAMMERRPVPDSTLLIGKFENLFKGKYDRYLTELFNQKMKNCDSIYCLDFCGMYTDSQHDSIVNFINLVKNLRAAHHNDSTFILNFLSPQTFRTTNKNSVMRLSEYYDMGLDMINFRASSCPAVRRSTEKYGSLLENVSPLLVEDAKLSNVEIFEPLHYQTGGRATIGYTTNIFKLKKEANNYGN